MCSSSPTISPKLHRPIPTLAPTAIQSAQCRQMWQNLGRKKPKALHLQCFRDPGICQKAAGSTRPFKRPMGWWIWMVNKGKESRKLKGKSLWGTGRTFSMIFLNRIYPRIYVLKSWILRCWNIFLVKCLCQIHFWCMYGGRGRTGAWSWEHFFLAHRSQ